MRCVRALYGLSTPGGRGSNPGLQGQQLVDAICVFIFISAVFFLRLVNAGALYFWMKDLTQEFLKLHVIATAVEILDKVAPATWLAARCACLAVAGNSHLVAAKCASARRAHNWETQASL